MILELYVTKEICVINVSHFSEFVLLEDSLSYTIHYSKNDEEITRVNPG